MASKHEQMNAGRTCPAWFAFNDTMECKYCGAFYWAHTHEKTLQLTGRTRPRWLRKLIPARLADAAEKVYRIREMERASQDVTC